MIHLDICAFLLIISTQAVNCTGDEFIISRNCWSSAVVLMRCVSWCQTNLFFFFAALLMTVFISICTFQGFTHSFVQLVPGVLGVLGVLVSFQLVMRLQILFSF